MPTIVKLECEATSVLLQVLYALHRGHVQFLMADYRSRIIEAYPNAFTKIRLPRLGKDGLPLQIRDVGLNTNSSDNTVDMSLVDDDGTSSDIDTNDGSGSEANAFTSSTSLAVPQHPSKKGKTAPPKDIEAAGFGSDTSPRTEMGDNDELDQ
jgi:hypothetical protein